MSSQFELRVEMPHAQPRARGMLFDPFQLGPVTLIHGGKTVFSTTDYVPLLLHELLIAWEQISEKDGTAFASLTDHPFTFAVSSMGALVRIEGFATLSAAESRDPRRRLFSPLDMPRKHFQAALRDASNNALGVLEGIFPTGRKHEVMRSLIKASRWKPDS